MTLFQDPLKGICPKGHLHNFHPPSQFWHRALDRKMRGTSDPLPIDSDQCATCLEAERDKILGNPDDQVCDLGCDYHPLKTICLDCPAGALLAIVDKKRNKIFELAYS